MSMTQTDVATVIAVMNGQDERIWNLTERAAKLEEALSWICYAKDGVEIGDAIAAGRKTLKALT